ncbi:MAG: glycosyltransferase [Pseudomonadota bacterium]
MTNSILHVSGDFPDPIEPFKTPVIKSLLELTAQAFDHRVVSINRTTPSPSKLASHLFGSVGASDIAQNEQLFKFGTALEYIAPSRGIFHRTMLERLGEHLANLINAQEVPFELLVGHKLTIEGIAVAKAAKLTGLPYALTIQGNTDRRILKARPDLRGHFRSIYLNAKTVCSFTPIAKNAIEEMLGKRTDDIALIPCPTELDTIISPKVSRGDIISVFHLKNYAVKNLTNLAAAATRLTGEEGKRRITILGGGNAKDLANCEAIAKQAGQIRFGGPVAREEMQEQMNKACALVLPSRAESFGLVFVEALFAGLPIIYPKGTAIDGYFDGLQFAQGVDANSPGAIAEAIGRAVREEETMKEALCEWQGSSEAEMFTRAAIAEKYQAALYSALDKQPKSVL